MSRIADFLLTLAVLALCAAIAAGLLSLTGMIEADNRLVGALGWYCELLVNFQLPYAVAIAGIAPLLVLRRRWKSLLAVALCAAPVAVMLWPYVPAATRATEASAGALTIATANLWYDSVDPARLRAYLREQDVDVVVLTEASSRWRTLLLDEYPYRVTSLSPSGHWHAVFVLSRHRIEPPPESLRDWGASGVAGRICPADAGRCITVVGLHAPAPLPRIQSLRRDEQLLATAEAIAGAGRETFVVAGDLNATPWSRGFRTLLARSGLRDSAWGGGLRPTWNRRWMVAAVPIDHVLHGADLRTVWRSVGPDLGSDHLPVVVRLAW